MVRRRAGEGVAHGAGGGTGRFVILKVAKELCFFAHKGHCQMFPVDKFREECGVVGIYAHPEAEKLAYLSLHALQHRGQESAGIVSSDGMSLHVYKDMGPVAEIFTEEVLSRLHGRLAIGHTRYSTA